MVDTSDYIYRHSKDQESDQDYDMPELSSAALAALQQFYKEEEQRESEFERMKLLAATAGNSARKAEIDLFGEDWQLSQFWYSDDTAKFLAQVARDHKHNNDDDSDDNGGLAIFLSCPTAFLKYTEMFPDCADSLLLEFDTRFDIYGPRYVQYDYNQPTTFTGASADVNWRLNSKKASIIIIDPPFLNEDCFSKFIATAKHLSNNRTKILISTGAIVAPFATKSGFRETNFAPEHRSKLSNIFTSYSNFESDKIKWK